PGGELVTIYTDSHTGKHLAALSQRPGFGLYTLTTESALVAEFDLVAASSQVAASGQAASNVCYRVIGPFHLVLLSRVPPPPVLPQPPESSLTVLHDPLSDYLRASRPVISRVLSALVTHPTAPLSSVSALVTTVAGFASSHRLDYAAHLVSGPARSPSSRGALVFPQEVLEDREFELGFLAIAVPHLCAMLLAPEKYPDTLHIPIPRTHAEAVSGPWALYLIVAEEAEMASYRSTGTYVDAVPPLGTKFVNGRWLYKVKRPPGSPPVFKARYVARGFTLDFFPSFADPSLFVRRGSTPFFVLVYVDDLVFATPDQRALASVKEELQRRHTCTDLGALQHYLGLQITRDRAARTITLTQSHMVEQILMRFRFLFSKVQLTPLAVDHGLTAPPSDESFESRGPYRELVGCLMYLMTCTRQDLAYPLSVLARFVAPGRHCPSHWYVAKRVAKYVASTSGMGLFLGGKQPVTLTGFSDSSWADDAETRRSTQGYSFSLGTGAVLWRSTRASSLSSSSCEGEVYTTAMAAQELHWLTFLPTDLGERPCSPLVLFVDNRSAVLLCEEPRLVGKAKHIQLRYFLLRELQQRGQALVRHVVSEANTADVFTKALPPCDHQRFCTQLGLGPAPLGVSQVDPPPLVEPLEISYDSSGPAEGGDLAADDTAATPVDTGAARGGDTGGKDAGGAGPGGADTRGAEIGGAASPSGGTGGTGAAGAACPGGARTRGAGAAGASGAIGAGSGGGASRGTGGTTKGDFETTAAFTLVNELVDFASRRRLDYVASLVSESESICPPSLWGDPALSSDVLEDRHFELDCLAAALPRFASMLLCPKGDPDAPDIPTPRSYAEAITGEYSSQWQTAMDVEMASWKSTGTYVDEVPPLGANIGVDFFHTFSPTPKMTTLRVLLHVAAQRDYELHSLDFSTAFLHGSLHKEIWLRRPPGFTWSFPAGTLSSLRRPVDGLRQAPREWHDTVRTTLAALGFAPSSADASLFLRTDTFRPPFYVLVYVDDLVFATADTKALALVKAELHELHTCTKLGPSALRLPVLLAIAHSSACWHLALNSTFRRVRRAKCCEAEIYAGAMAAQELHWLTYLLTDFGERPRSPQVLYIDNKAMLSLCHEQRLKHRMKHIALRYFHARELHQGGQLHLSFVASRANTADV
ncbi:unnamed protein product, partial [Closterium sp. NIES-54]